MALWFMGKVESEDFVDNDLHRMCWRGVGFGNNGGYGGQVGGDI